MPKLLRQPPIHCGVGVAVLGGFGGVVKTHTRQGIFGKSGAEEPGIEMDRVEDAQGLKVVVEGVITAAPNEIEAGESFVFLKGACEQADQDVGGSAGHAEIDRDSLPVFIAMPLIESNTIFRGRYVTVVRE